MIAYGPVPSRRLGQSLGINNIPPKICTYSCVYCQVGRTIKMQIDRNEYYPLGKIIEDVRKELLNADWVSVKVDSTLEETWRKINHPHRKLNLESVLQGILEFSKAYRGELTTETMLVKDMNDGEEQVEGVARYLAMVKPAKAYIAIPTRPPADVKIHSPEEAIINRSY